MDKVNNRLELAGQLHQFEGCQTLTAGQKVEGSICRSANLRNGQTQKDSSKVLRHQSVTRSVTRVFPLNGSHTEVLVKKLRFFFGFSGHWNRYKTFPTAEREHVKLAKTGDFYIFPDLLSLKTFLSY